MMRKSLQRAVGMGSKAQTLLGFSNDSNLSGFQTQREGYLFKKPFSKSFGGGTLKGNWQKRYFVLKDSFLFWYSSKPNVSFDINPNGCLPLGGCSVFPMGKEKDGGFVFEVSHPDFGGNVLQLKSKDKAEVDDWIKVLQDCSKATWENAQLGDALIQKLKHAGTNLEKETEKALTEARRNAEVANEERNEKLDLMERQLEAQRQYEEELLQQKQQTMNLESDLQAKDRALAREKLEQEEERKRTIEMEKKLKDALAAIEQLEAALERRQRRDLEGMETRLNNPELQEQLDTIKQFLSNRQD